MVYFGRRTPYYFYHSTHMEERNAPVLPETPTPAPAPISEKPKTLLTLPIAIVLAAVILAAAAIFIWAPRSAASPKEAELTDAQVAGMVQEIIASKGKIALPPVTEADHARGAENPKLTLVEYSDLECPYCKKFHESMYKIMKEYGEDVSWVYRHFPLDCTDNTSKNCQVLHVKARPEAIAAECAAVQGGDEAFWKFTDRIFSITSSNDGLPESELTKTAKKIGLDTAAFDTCVTDKATASIVSAQAKGGVALGVTGTPSSVIITPEGTTYLIPGAYPHKVVAGVIKELLAEK